jgi:hypothetical protein
VKPWTGEADGLSSRIAAWIDAALDGAPPPEPWEALALAVYRFQVARDPVLASLVERPVHEWQDIPAVPVGLFKDLPVGTVDPADAAVTFLTSGTTGTGRGAHRLRGTTLIDRAAWRWAVAAVGALPERIVALLEDPALAPDSSLSHMIASFPGRKTWCVRSGELGPVPLGAEPVFLPATAFAAAAWLATHPPPAPAGSVAMITGGFKGRVHQLDEPALLAALGVRGWKVVREYGMTELSSQLWADQRGPFRPPPWLVVRAADPATGALLPPGQAGQLRFWDLANLDGTLAIETLDGGVVQADGTLELHGRLPGAPARGCSLTVEEAWARRSR